MRKNTFGKVLAALMTTTLTFGLLTGCGNSANSAAEKTTEKAEQKITEESTKKAEQETTEENTKKAEQESTEKSTEKAEQETTEESTEKAAETEAESAQKDTQEVTPVVAALIGTSTLYAYVDETGELVGYNIDVLNEVFDHLPQYELSFEKTEFSSILPGLDTGIYQIGAQAFISNADRRKNYLFTESFGKYIFKIVTLTKRDDIRSWKDLGGKTVVENPDNGPVAIYKAYNEEFPDNPINLQLSESVSDGLQNLLVGRQDFYVSGVVAETLAAEEYGVADQIKFVDFGEDAPEYFNENQYFGFIVSKNNPQLAEDFNKELEKLIEDGTLEKLSKKWFGSADYATTIEEAQAFRDAVE